MTNEIIEFYREHLKPIIQKMLLETNYQGQGEVDYEEFGRDFDELLDLAIIGMQSNSDEDCISRAEAIKAVREAYSIYIPRMNGWEKGLSLKIDKAIYDLPSIQPKSKTDVLDKIRADRDRLQENIKALGEDMRICQKSITDEKVLIGFNMAVALCNKHLAEGEDKE